MIKAVLFDMDGVLIDTERMGQRVMNEVIESLGYQPSATLYPKVLGATNEAGRRAFEEELGADYPYDEHVRRFLDVYARVNATGDIPRKPGADECLRALKAMGIRTALATSTATWLVNDYFAKSLPDWALLLDARVTGAEVKRSKPAPDIYLAAAAAVGCAPGECVGVEDSLNGCRAIRAAGMTCVMVPDLLPFGEPFAPYVDRVIGNLAELPELLRTL